MKVDEEYIHVTNNLVENYFSIAYALEKEKKTILGKKWIENKIILTHKNSGLMFLIFFLQVIVYDGIPQ